MAAEKKQPQTIVLQTVDASEIPLHLAANGRCRTCDSFAPAVPFPPDAENPPVCECDEPNRVPVISSRDEFWGKTVAICGAGPSLKDAYKIIRKADHVWGCNRAANFLAEWGWNLTHAFGIDASTAMFTKCWPNPPEVSGSYLLATSVHPRLVDHLLEHDRKIQLFHSIRGGIKDEAKLYRLIFPSPCPIAGNGLNSVNRAVGLASQLGYRRAWVCGADNSVKDTFYADGSDRPDSVYLEGNVFGRTWKTTPDMLMSATDLARMKWAFPEWLELVGNTLPRALSRTSETFLDRCVRWATEEEDEAARAGLEAQESNVCAVADD